MLAEQGMHSSLYWGSSMLGCISKHLYINSHSMGNQQEELEICAPLQGYDLVGITETRGVADRTGVQKWIGTGFLGMKSWEDEEDQMPFR